MSLCCSTALTDYQSTLSSLVAVILNEHLTEALRRLNRDQSDTNVDRRLVTNVLLQFLTTPRQDAKRFEMLMLLSTILHWSDEEKEAAGVQRSSVPGGSRFGVGVSSSKSPGRGQRSVTSGQEEVSRCSEIMDVTCLSMLTVYAPLP